MTSERHSRQAITIVASVGVNNELGRDGDLCWHIPEDLKHFKELTMGGAVIMGRKTWESLPRKPLPGRINIIITRNENAGETEGITTGSIAEALELAGDSTPFIIGGESIYGACMDLADTLELTRIYDTDPEADKFFPEIDENDWELVDSSEKMTSQKGITFRYETYKRRVSK